MAAKLKLPELPKPSKPVKLPKANLATLESARFSKVSLVIFMLVFGGIGGYVLLSSHAASTPSATYACSGRSFYIDYAGGSDTNAGTSQSAAWQRVPGMVGFAGTYTHQAHDCFYFKGGVTWPNSVFPLTPTGSGDTTADDYYGPDITWYTGAAWSRPIFNAGGTPIIGSFNGFLNLDYLSYVTFDNFELTEFNWPDTTCTYGSVAQIHTMQATNITLDHLYVHNWSTAGQTCRGFVLLGDTNAPYVSGSILENSVIEDSDGGADDGNGHKTGWGTVAYAFPQFKNNVIHNVEDMLLPTGHGEISGNSMYNCFFPSAASSTHGNVLETLSADGAFYIHDNVIHDTTEDSRGNECESMFVGNNGENDYVWNNVLYNLGGNSIALDQNTSPGILGYFWNNTISSGWGNTQDCFYAGHPGTWQTLVIQNNLCITSTSVGTQGVDNSGDANSVSATTLTIDHNLVLTPAQASTDGYTALQTYAYSPTAANSPTVDAGADLSANCSGSTAGLCSDTSYGVGVDANNEVITSVRTTNSRPQGAAWDIGAYELSDTISKCTSVTYHAPSGSANDITYTFDKDYPCGQFANGDWFVTPDSPGGTVTITNITPVFASGKNGWDVNPLAPTYNTPQHWTNLIAGYQDPVYSLPYVAHKDESIVKTVSMSTCAATDCIQYAAVLTVLDSAPANPATTFRPTAYGSSKKLFSTVGLKTDLLQRLSSSCCKEKISDSYAANIARNFRLDYSPNAVTGYYMIPADSVGSGRAWGGDMMLHDSEALGWLNLDDDCGLATCTAQQDLAAKTPVVIDFVQQGIDLWGADSQGNGGWYRGGGGNGAGKLMTLTFAATMLQDSTLRDYLKTINPSHFWETSSFYRGTKGVALWGQPNGNESQYWDEFENPNAGTRTIIDPYGYIDGGPIPGGWYQGITADPVSYLSFLMEAIPQLKTNWPTVNDNANVIYEYGQRWHSHGAWTQGDPCAPKTGTYGVDYGPDGNGSCIKGAGRGAADGYKDPGAPRKSAFMEEVYAAYNISTPPTITLTASPSSIASGSSSTLSWSSTNADSCTATGAWSGSKATSGSSSTGSLTSSRTYVLNCTGPGGSSQKSITVNVTNSGSTSTTHYPTGDLNHDGQVDIYDLSILLSNYNHSGTSSADIDGNKLVNIYDLSILLSNYDA